MKAITMQQFLVRQPSWPDRQPTDEYYLKVANLLLDRTVGSRILEGIPDGVVQRAVLTAVGYFQDVVCDGGVWHAFVDECRSLYGRPIPFYPTGEDYIDYELNEPDLRFIAWYGLAMNWNEIRLLSPDDKRIADVAAVWYKELERLYEDAPDPEGHRPHVEMEIGNPEDEKALMHYSTWLFMHCYLMTPAFGLTLDEIMAEPGMSDPNNLPALHERLEQAMMEDPTGPLALYLREWLYLVIENRMPPEPVGNDESVPAEHPYYAKFTAYTGGSTLAFFNDYESLNRFFIDALGWEEGVEHLSQMKVSEGFVLMVDRNKGMLVARGVAKCIAAPDNPYYDREYASAHAIELLTVRGLCPGDLLRRVCSEGWLPDAVFPGDYRTAEEKETALGLVRDNWDFTARCYLQQYYRGD